MDINEMRDIIASKLSKFDIDPDLAWETTPNNVSTFDCNMSIDPEDIWIELPDKPLKFTFNNAVVNWDGNKSNPVSGSGSLMLEGGNIFIRDFMIFDHVDFAAEAEEYYESET